eukprot:Gregarina_sp_Poly_1__3852@NODE_214_length_11311_cov_270_018855_g190_i0_p2_GENE_NODE_214_length_11311_cov_270_018855_g190_i0NODE_214_length_11311_cov_270_018855_g190_i0_p2_ORF_typecomplete_len824_score133_94DEAD/PF00270_29/4_6e37Helicase_C/PF00271_31/4_6e02Helicase_C/PF00271_31/4_8e02Helicase_C/PF00271_31/1_6e22DUF4217/PF13959_6/1_2e09ResIII/PF04851_15/1e07ERCC3_RAD25_C/PF16203_5/89ERCC3_RAD25_C/PF16203_5/1_2e05_NODE_214_length_11311_cov_270_018855_g190_i0854611017
MGKRRPEEVKLDAEKSTKEKKRKLEDGVNEALKKGAHEEAEAGDGVTSGVTFEDLRWGPRQEYKMEPRLIRQLNFLKFHVATKVQAESLRRLADPRNVVDGMIRSQTGSGKTLAFLLPPLDKLLKLEANKRENMIKAKVLSANDKSFVIARSMGTRVLIISPTRELALQTEAVAKRLTQMFPWISTLALVGGAKKKSEKASLRKGAVILVATPGRILDHLGTTSSFRNSFLMTLVLDEADRLLDMGFECKLRKIVHELKENLRGVKLPPKIVKSSPSSFYSASAERDQLAAERAAQKELMRAIAAGRISKSEPEQETPPDSSHDSGNEEEATDGKECLVKISTLLEKFESPTKSFQVIVASATLSNGISALAKFCLGEDRVSIDSLNMQSSDLLQEETDDAATHSTQADTPAKWNVPNTLKQAYVKIDNMKQRLLCLICLLKMRTNSNKKCLVFVNGCEEVDFLQALCESLKWPNPPESVDSRRKFLGQEKHKIIETAKNMLTEVDDLLFNMSDDETNARSGSGLFSVERVLEGLNCFKLHGSMSREDRLGNITDFKNCKTACVLFTTDVAARGLNLPSVDLVIQVTPPLEICDYVHRVGRTARMGAPGTSVLFLLTHETKYVNALETNNICPNGIKERSQSAILQVLMPVTARKPKAVECLLPSPLGKLREKDALNFLMSRFTMFVEDDEALTHLARKAYQAFVKSYRVYGKETREYFNAENLHLGHVAGSFFIKCSPNEIAKKLEGNTSVSTETAHKRTDATRGGGRGNVRGPSRGSMRGRGSGNRGISGSMRSRDNSGGGSMRGRGSSRGRSRSRGGRNR